MTATVKTKMPLTVPDEIQRRAGFKPGDRVVFKVARGVVTILTKPIPTHDSDDTLAPAEAKKVRHALKQARQGKTTPWRQVRHDLGL